MLVLRLIFRRFRLADIVDHDAQPFDRLFRSLRTLQVVHLKRLDHQRAVTCNDPLNTVSLLLLAAS